VNLELNPTTIVSFARSLQYREQVETHSVKGGLVASGHAVAGAPMF